MASARKTGTNESVSTYGTGQDYTALATWEAATDNDLVTATTTEVLECVDTDASFDDNTLLFGATTSSSYFRIIRPQSGSGHDGTSNNGVFFAHSTNDFHSFNIAESYSAVQDLIVSQTINSANNRYVLRTGGAGTAMEFTGMIVFDSTNSGAGLCSGAEADGINTIWRLCLIDNCELHGFVANAGSTNAANYDNCTVVDNIAGNGWNYLSGVGVCTNCLADNSGDGDFESSGTWTGSDYCATSDTTSPDSGANNRTEQTFTFVSEAGDDFHLALADAGAKGFGNDLSASFTDDIDGDTISDWPIGFDEPVATAAGIRSLRQLVGVGQGTRA
jgi:hypothetical protein